MKINSKRKGFSLIEILMIVAIIGILVSVILVNITNSRNKAQNNSAFTSFKSLAAPAFVCLTSGSPSVALTALNPGFNICSNPAATVGSVWPIFSKYGWNNFYWCDLNAAQGTVPATGSYANGSFGGEEVSGKFCFMLQRDTKLMWCTLEGCRKDGF